MIVKPTAAHMAFRDELLAEFKRIATKYDDQVPAIQQLAVLSHILGQAIAMQDQRKYTAPMVMKMVADNIEQGNQEVLLNLLNSKGAA